ncbi:MAG: hypothetical protein F6K14_33780 [Symploca sp. SIO2C1]|nr:hypothetical protein [Symploca sp. SIO2C1]
MKFTVALKKHEAGGSEAGGKRKEDLTKVSSLITHYSLLITQKSSPTPFFTSPAPANLSSMVAIAFSI